MALPRPTTSDNLLSGVTQLVDALETRFKAVDSELLDGIDSTGFLQLATASPRRLAFGTATLTWPGATSLSNILTVAHGLAATPTVVFGIARDDQGGDVSAVGIDGAPDSTNVSFRANSRISPTNPSSTTLYWLAIA